jgi:hypothetical protein
MNAITWKGFAAGLVCGLVLGFGAFHVFGQRYRVEPGGPAVPWVVRLDTWSGKSWMGRTEGGGKVWYWQPVEERTP